MAIGKRVRDLWQTEADKGALVEGGAVSSIVTELLQASISEGTEPPCSMSLLLRPQEYPSFQRGYLPSTKATSSPCIPFNPQLLSLLTFFLVLLYPYITTCCSG